MSRITGIVALGMVLLLAFVPAKAQSADERSDQKQTTQKDRQLERSERNEAIKDATREFRDFTRELKSEYRDRVNELETEFELQRVEMRAAHDARVAEAEAEHQKKLADLLAQPDMQLDAATIEKLQAEAKAFSDELFALRREAAEALHRARIAKEARQNAILTEQDQLALEKASSLGLTRDYAPILAEPAGEGLTPKEERWNERERREVERLEDRIAKLLSEFRTGEALREWEIENLEEDFALEWDEKQKLHALEANRIFYEALLAQAPQGGSFDQKKLANRITELSKQRELIKIRYKEIRDRIRIQRREEKSELLAY